MRSSLRPPPFRQIYQYIARRSRRSYSSTNSTGQKCTSTSEITPPNLQRWITEITSRPPETHTDTLDPLRAAQLLRSLPTRQYLDAVSVGDGDNLAQGSHMVYFQPETMLKDLGYDGSSPVSLIITTPYLLGCVCQESGSGAGSLDVRLTGNVGIQRPIPLHPQNVGRRIHLIPRLQLQLTQSENRP